MSIGIGRAHRITERSIKFVGSLKHDEVINENDKLVRLNIPGNKIPVLQDVIANSGIFGVPAEGKFSINKDLIRINENSTFFDVREIVRKNTVTT